MIEAENDKRKITLMIEMFSQIDRLKFQTKIGQEFKETMTLALEENIKPFARDCYKALCSTDDTKTKETNS